MRFKQESGISTAFRSIPRSLRISANHSNSKVRMGNPLISMAQSSCCIAPFTRRRSPAAKSSLNLFSGIRFHVGRSTRQP